MIVERVARVATARQLPRAQVAATHGATTAGHRGLGRLSAIMIPWPVGLGAHRWSIGQPSSFRVTHWVLLGGRPAVAVSRGEAGIGTSRLAAQATIRTISDGCWRVLSGGLWTRPRALVDAPKVVSVRAEWYVRTKEQRHGG